MDRWLAVWQQLLWADGRVTLYALAGIGVLTLLELARPAEPGQSWRGRGRNVLFLAQFKLLGLAGLAAWYVFGPGPRESLLQPGLLGGGWPERIALVFANLVAIDLLFYWYHRAQHRFDFLWAIHELHHADTELNATTSYRTYWLETPIQTALVITPTVLVFGGLGPTHAVVVLAFSLFFLVFSHANLRLRLGPLTGWVIGPQVHRVHHSRLPGHRDRNFAQYFPFLDRLFGSWYAPARDEFPPTGADGLAGDASLPTVLARPFRIWLGAAGQR